MNNPKIHTKDIFRIFSPSEYKLLLAGIPKVENRFLIEMMLNTGMRYVELQRFESKYFNPKTRDITLPANITKTKRGRCVQLTPNFSRLLEVFISHAKVTYPSRATMNVNLERWSAELGWAPDCKTFRKTIETWLIYAGYDAFKVAISQGHSTTVQIAHYQNMSSCLKNELAEVKKFTEGWMT